MKSLTVFILTLVLIAAMAVTTATAQEPIEEDAALLAEQVLEKYRATFERADIQEMLLAFLQGFKGDWIQEVMEVLGAEEALRDLHQLPFQIVAAKDAALRKPLATLLETDAEVQAMFSDVQVQALIQNPVAIDELVSALDGAGPPVVAPTVDLAQPIHIPDAELARIIRKALGLDEGATITGVAMHKLTQLEAVGKGIADLTGLEYATNLRDLSLNNTNVSDISALANLTQLEALRLRDTAVSDVSALAKLTKLEQLRLRDTAVSDVSALVKLTQLKELGLGATNVSDISALVKLTNLERLSLNNTNVSDISALANLTNLEGLYLRDTAVSDISALVKLTNLEGLGLSATNVSDISALANLMNLEVLYLGGTQVSDISALAKLTNLERLDLSDTAVSDISALAKLTNLERLDLSDTAVSDISALAKLTKLRWLDLSGCPLSHASYFTHIPALQAKGIKVAFGIHIPDTNLAKAVREALGLGEEELIPAGTMEVLDIRDTAVSDISALAKLTQLKELNLSDTQVSDISALAKLTQLKVLYLGGTQVSDISALAKLTQLKWLYLSATNVSDVSALAKLTKLEQLNLFDTNVSDVSALAKLTQLKQLGLGDTAVSDISALAKLTQLRWLGLSGCPLSYASLHTHIPALQARGVKVGFDSRRDCASSIPENLVPLEPVRIEPITQKKQIVQEGDFQGATVKFAPQVNNGKSRAWTPWQTVAGRKYKGTLGTVVITAKILNGTAAQKRMIKRAAADWERNGNLFFRFVDSGEADVQISINTKKESDGGWVSPLGGWESGSKMELYNGFSYGTCLHEFGHVLGLMHEHLSPRFLDLVEWAYEGDELIAEIRKDGLPHWSEKKIRDNILTPREVGPAAKFDPDSVMTYPMSSELFKARPNAPNPTLANEIATNGTKDNSELSADDKGLLRHIYGNPSQKVIVEGSISIDGVDDESWKVKLKPIKVWGVTVGWRPVWKDDETINDSESFGPRVFTSIDEYTLTLQQENPNPNARFKWGGECRVDVYLSTRKVVEGKHIEMAASVFLFEGTSENTTDLDDFKCVDFDVPLDGSEEVTLKLNNKFWQDNDRPLLAIDARARRCRSIDIDVSESGLNFRGDVLGGGDWADVTISLSAKTIDNVSELLKAAKAAAAPAAATVKHQPSQKLSDVNGDGQVTVADLMLVSNHIGQTILSDSRVDLNADGIVTIVDLVHVAQHLGQSTDPAAPAHIVAPKGLAYETVAGWLNRARAADDGSRPFLQGITNLERLLLLIIPEKTALLHNYPNPFNPETWIPYHLAEPAEVTLTLYTADGKVVRTLALGHQSAGFYQSRSRAAYWDGRNEVGERVASGVYFYTLTAGEFSTTRKMVIRK